MLDKVEDMVKENDRTSRESSIASGWTVEGQSESLPAASARPRSGAAHSASTAEDSVLDTDAGLSPGEVRGSVPDASDAADALAASEVVGATEALDAAEAVNARKQLSNTALVLLGLLGGVYLLYTMVWFSWANYYSAVNSVVAEGSGSLGGILQQVTFWLAPLAPALWFISVLALCSGSGFAKRALWLVVGAIVLVPLPMFGGLF